MLEISSVNAFGYFKLVTNVQFTIWIVRTLDEFHIYTPIIKAGQPGFLHPNVGLISTRFASFGRFGKLYMVVFSYRRIIPFLEESFQNAFVIFPLRTLNIGQLQFESRVHGENDLSNHFSAQFDEKSRTFSHLTTVIVNSIGLFKIHFREQIRRFEDSFYQDIFLLVSFSERIFIQCLYFTKHFIFSQMLQIFNLIELDFSVHQYVNIISKLPFFE